MTGRALPLNLGTGSLAVYLRLSAVAFIDAATLAALVGAGGYGAPIVSGLSLNDVPTILTGAIPAALMAWLAHGLFEVLSKIFIPAGLRVRP